ALPFDALDFSGHEAFWKGLSDPPDGVLCAFGHLGPAAPDDLHWPETRRIVEVNYLGAMSILNLAARDFANRGAGFIIGISSGGGDRGRSQNLVYGSAKAGFSAYLSGLRSRFHCRGVRVLTVKPGLVRTQMTAHLQLPPLLTASPDRVAEGVFRAWRQHRNVLYTPWPWVWIWRVIRHLPEPLFVRIFGDRPPPGPGPAGKPPA
ncbi:MAG TPA: SDR family NAD(P)-dependent oxidoreductase, partial [Candidatus Aminicenantes bacterium]|nr:SDR family NAD(P)-dependent oxidoreductase [Candidatus Aminicenantes bacterium]